MAANAGKDTDNKYQRKKKPYSLLVWVQAPADTMKLQGGDYKTPVPQETFALKWSRLF